MQPAAGPSPIATQPALLAAQTRRLYAADWAGFAAWCQLSGHAALPAAAATLAAYLRAAPLRYGTLARRAAAVAAMHRRHGLPSPAADPAVTAILRAARQRAGARRRPLPASTLTGLAARCGADAAGRRDRALLLLAANGLGRAALVGLDAEAIRFTATGAELGPGRMLARDAGAACPVRALEDWLRRSDTRFGPVFRKVDRWGNVEHRRMGTDAVRRILRRRGG